MIETIPVTGDHAYAFRLKGKLSHSEYLDFLPMLDELIRSDDTLSLLFELDDFHGWEWAAAREDYRYGMNKQMHFEKVAIVGEAAWQKWMTILANPFVSSEVRYFDRASVDEAWAWLNTQPRPLPAVPEPGDYRHILVGTDFSRYSDYATQRAAIMARQQQARLTLIHVVEDAIMFAEYPDYITTDLDVEKSLVESAEQRLQAVVSGLSGLQVTGLVEIGNPANIITEYAAAQHCDLIITASHGRKGLGRLLGSTATRVEEHAGCDVLTVRLPAGQ
jgi:nucleotide-binding universal stress UspA family protein